MAFTFSADGKELWCDTPEPARRFDNMLYNKAYFTMIDQCARGRGVHMTGDGYVNNVIAAERIIYIRDDESGEYFSAGWAPVYRPCESYRCGSGLNYQIIENVTNRLNVRWRIYVPAGEDPVEVWDVRVEDLRGGPRSRARNVSLFTCVEMNCDGTDTYGGSLFRLARYDAEADAIFVRQDAELHGEIDFPRHNGFFTASRTPDGWDANREKFIGPRRTPANPLAVKRGRCEGRIASMWTPTAAMHFRLEVLPGGWQDTRMLVGACDGPAMIARLRGKYLRGTPDADPHFDALAAERSEMMRNIRIETPEESVNLMLNTWVKHQIHYGATWVRWGYKGYRDIVQQSQGVLTQDAPLALANLKKACRHQYSDGFALRGWDPLDRMRYADSAQWLISAVTEYVKETGDFALLDEPIPYFDEGEGTVYEHLTRAMERLSSDRGRHGLCLAFFGDWNDSLTGVCREGRGESVWLSMAFCRSALLMKELAAFLGRDDDAAAAGRRHAEMSEAVNKSAWDGEWYVRAFDDDGEAIGSASNEEGRIFLNTQSWAQLGGVVGPERWETLLASVERRLGTGWGLMLNWPTYTGPRANIGRLSYLRPGICENGSVYTHGNAFMLLALLERGMADRALELWREIVPGNPRRPAECQPNVFMNGYFGPDSDIAPGTAEHAWVTGSAAWMFLCVTEHMLGLRRGYDGITVRPCMPGEWSSASITRTYRGTTYRVAIRNPAGIEAAPVAGITVDGAGHPPGRPLPIDGGDHEVEVTLGGA